MSTNKLKKFQLLYFVPYFVFFFSDLVDNLLVRNSVVKNRFNGCLIINGIQTITNTLNGDMFVDEND